MTTGIHTKTPLIEELNETFPTTDWGHPVRIKYVPTSPIKPFYGLLNPKRERTTIRGNDAHLQQIGAAAFRVALQEPICPVESLTMLDAILAAGDVGVIRLDQEFLRREADIGHPSKQFKEQILERNKVRYNFSAAPQELMRSHIISRLDSRHLTGQVYDAYAFEGTFWRYSRVINFIALAVHNIGLWAGEIGRVIEKNGQIGQVELMTCYQIHPIFRAPFNPHYIGQTITDRSPVQVGESEIDSYYHRINSIAVRSANSATAH